MNNFIFENRTRVYFGRGCVKEYLASLVRNYETVMLAYGRGSIKKNGIYDELLYILQKEGKTIVEFSGITPNPTYEKAMEGIRLVRDKRAELILGVGGGSVMDCCKAMALGAAYEGNWWKDYWERNGIIDFSVLPLGVIVTAEGSGSACNGTSVLVKGKRKIGRDYEKCSPVFALIDPVYTFSESPAQVLANGIASLSHVMEIYFSRPDEDNVSDDLAEALMKSIIRNLKKAAEDSENYEARSNLLWASALAKNRIIKVGKRGDFTCRQIERQLEAHTGCLHGQDCAVLRPAYYRRLCGEQPGKFARFAVNVWAAPAEDRTEEELAREGVQALTDFINGLGLPKNLRELGVKNTAALKQIAEECASTAGSYREMGHEEILQLLEECF